MWHRKATSSSLRCSFCHKPKDEVEQLLAGPRGVYICNSCVDCCQQVMRDASEGSSQFPLAPKRCVIVFLLPHSQTQPGGKGLRNAEQLDRHPSSHERTRIAGQPFCPREPRVGTLGTGKGRRRDSEAGRGGRLDLELDALMAHQLDARPSVVPTAPVTPENGFRPNDQWMQQHTYLARLLGGAALPLTLLAQGTGTATTNTGRIDDAQAPIGFSALLMGKQRLASGTAQRPILLERKVLTREAVRFPGQAHLRGSIA